MIFTSDFLFKFKLNEESLEILSSQDLTSKEDLKEMSKSDINSLGLKIGQKLKLKRGIKRLHETTREQEGTAAKVCKTDDNDDDDARISE